jgi:hypothetical protein
MASCFYDEHVMDYGDLENVTGRCPGYRLRVLENDGGISVQMGPIKNDPDDQSYYRGFMDILEATELWRSLDTAIMRAESKWEKNEKRLSVKLILAAILYLRKLASRMDANYFQQE